MRFRTELEREDRDNELARKDQRAEQVERFGVRPIKSPPRFGYLRHGNATVTVIDDVRKEERTFSMGDYDQMHNWREGQIRRSGQ